MMSTIKLDLPEDVTSVIEKFQEADFKIYIVGGAVRDLLLDREVRDWDFTTDATPEEILKLYPDGFYNNQFGTVGIKLNERVYEVTTMRREGEYEDFRHPESISWTDKIEEDLQRRDFTINAMALLVSEKSEDLSLIARDDRMGARDDIVVVDPFNGQKDLKQQIIRAAGDPKKRFNEDALRLIRAIRFATQLQFIIEQETFEQIKENSHLIEKISWERIRDELFKILATDYPYEGMLLLRNCGLLKYILPEVERCFGVVQEGPKHDRVYDIGDHCLLSLKFCPSKDHLVRLATLVHDVGKPDTQHIQADGNVTFYGHDVVGGRIAQKIAERFRLSKKDSEKLEKLVRWHLFTVDENQTDSAIRRFIKNVGLENIDDMIDLRIADRLGGGTQKAVSWRMEKFRDRIKQILEKPFSITDLKINGKDVMNTLNIKPSKKVGEILEELFQEVTKDYGKNNRDYLLKRVKELMS